MKRIRLLLTLVALFALMGVRANDTGLKLHFDFSNATGNNVPEVVSGGTINGQLMNNAKIVKIGKYYMLDLGADNGYFDMTAQAGEILKGCDDWSISMYYYIDPTQNITEAGNFLFSFSSNTACTADAGQYYAYRVNVQRYATSTGGFGNEAGMEVGRAAEKGHWANVTYVQNGKIGTLYVDGQQVATADKMPLTSEMFKSEKPVYNWIGRAPFANDVYLRNTKVADIRLYGRSLANAEITRLAIATNDIEQEYYHGEQGSLTELNKLLSETETLLKGDLSGYASDAVLLLTDSYKMVKSKVDSEKLSQYAIDEYAATLQASLTTFKSTNGFAFVSTELMPAYDVNRGFRHPGGLHTDADFERIKAQLAAGDKKVTSAYNLLKNSVWAQPDCATWPVETVIRGAGAQNYINAARGAAIAYQNGLRWKIEGNEACAKHAVEVLNSWASVCKGIGGNSNYALAAGLYGYEFAQAAELVRDYSGWKEKDFEKFKRWMLDVWYPSAIGFQRGRNGTWENGANKPNAGWGTAGDRPGHYWSNWGLCNTLCLVSIGILCDDVFIYNQGLSFMKYDLAALTGSCPAQKRTETDIWNNGLTEYIDYLIPNVADYAEETGAYGKVGQMQESGRDQGHATMALGLAVDICQTAWNQGDDLYSYHDNRMAAGIEFTAALNNAGKEDLPWVTYHYADCRTAWHNSWNQGIAYGSQTRPYWGRVIGHYEGVKGVKMPFAEQALEQMGIDGGPAAGAGESGAYDHLGFSVLTNTYDGIADEEHRPTLLSPKMEYDGKVIDHNELGGLESTYLINTNMGVPTGKTVKLMPQLPEGAADTGNWEWNTGEKTRDITVNTDKSYLYRVTYTNENGIKSEQVFAIAVQGDCNPNTITSSVYSNGVWLGDTEGTVYYGGCVDLNVDGRGGWGDGLWSTGEKGTTLHINSVTSDREIKGQFITQGGKKQTVTFRIHVKNLQPHALVNNRLVTDTLSFACKENDNLVFYANVPSSVANVKYEWSDGSTGKYLVIDSLKSSKDYTLHVTGDGLDETMKFQALLVDEALVSLEAGDYAIYDVDNDMYLTNNGEADAASFKAIKGGESQIDDSQVWTLQPKVSGKTVKYDFISKVGGEKAYLAVSGMVVKKTYQPFYIRGLVGSDRKAIRTLTKEEYWQVDDEGTLKMKGATSLESFPFLIIPVKDGQLTGIENVEFADGDEIVKVEYFTISGAKTNDKVPGVNVVKYTTRSGKVVTKKLVVK